MAAKKKAGAKGAAKTTHKGAAVFDFDFLSYVRDMRKFLADQKFSLYLRKGAEFFTDAAEVVEKFEGGKPPVVGSAAVVADEDRQLADAEEQCGLMVMEAQAARSTAAPAGFAPVAFNPAAWLAIAQAALELIKFLRERRQAG